MASAQTYDPSHLRATLLSILNAESENNSEPFNTDGAGIQELFEEIMMAKPHLLRIFDVGERSEAEKREVESGRVTFNDHTLAINSDFARQVVFVSSQLNVSERYVTSLMQNIISRHPNLTSPQGGSGSNSEKLVEQTILEFHARRRHLADCLKYIAEAAVAGQLAEMLPAGEVPDVLRQLYIFVADELLPGGTPAAMKEMGIQISTGRQQGDIGFPWRLLREMDKVGETMAQVKMARQNARSETVGPGQGQEARLGADILTARLDSLHYERRTLSNVLIALCRLGFVSPDEIVLMVDWLQKHDQGLDPMTLHVMVAVLSCLEIVDGASPGGLTRRRYCDNKAFVSQLKKMLNPSGPTPVGGSQAQWRSTGLRSTLLLKWTLFLTDMRHRHPSLEGVDGCKADELESQIWNAVQGDSLSYLVKVITTLHERYSSDPTSLPTSYLSSGAVSRFDNHAIPLPGPEGQAELTAALLDAVESMVRWLITYASSELRKIKQRQEDVLLAGLRGDRSRMFRSTLGHARQFSHPVEQAPPPGGPPRNDIAMLFSLIGILYTLLPPERALQFWGGAIPPNQPVAYAYMAHVETTAARLPIFLQWSVWSTQIKDVDMLTALYDMLVGLSKGQQCSELTYNFLARGGPEAAANMPNQQGPAVSWSAIFGLLEQWTTTSQSPRPNQPPGNMPIGQQAHAQRQQPQPQQLSLSQQDVLLAQSFLRLLESVARYSVAVRTALSGHARFRPIPTLVSLIPLSIPLELKGALFDTLSSFCLPGAGVPGVEICKSVWTLMERMEIINVRAPPSTAVAAVKGVEVELEEVESAHKLYPETIPFLKLLSTLIHTPKSVSVKDLVADSEPLQTIPEGLGYPYRSPGVAPYTSFVVDKVFARIHHREYLKLSDRWRMNDLCLCYVEHSLASFDLESLVASRDEADVKPDVLISLVMQPGYDLLKRLLTHSQFQASVLSYIVDGLDGFDKGVDKDQPLFAKTIIRVLRIVQRILEIQDIFLDVFIPSLANLPDTSAIGEIHPVSYFVRLDQALLYHPQYVPALAAYISYPAHPELMLLSVKTLTLLATPANVAQLAVIIEKSSDSVRILDGYQDMLDTPSFIDVDAAARTVDEYTGAGAPDTDLPDDLLTQAIRVSILDFLSQNTQLSRPYPNIAHYLLFGKLNIDNQIQDPNALGARRACVHSILDILNDGVPRLNRDTRHIPLQPLAHQALSTRSPAFAERCYRILHQLCKHSRTSEFTMRYLRSREDFFTRHLASLPYHINPTLAGSYVEVQYSDSSRVITTVPMLCSSLRLRSTVFDLVALELHYLTSKGHSKGVASLLELLYGTEDEGHNEPDWTNDAFRPFHDVGQSHLRMIEFLQSLNFDWSDSLSVQPLSLEFFGHLNLQSCVRLDDWNCEVVDQASLIALLTLARRELHQQGRILTSAHVQQVETETEYIMQSCVIENHRRQVRHATMLCYESWRQLLDMSLVKCLDKIAPERREGLLFDLLHALPSALLSSTTPDATATILSEATLSVITKLREDRRHQALTQPAGRDGRVGTLPAERLFALLRSLLQCLMDNSHSELVRGNLYASLVTYAHLVTDVDTHADEPRALALIEGPSPRSDSPTPDALLRPQAPATSPLISGSMAIIKPSLERLVTLICRDATDGTEVWKTVAFVLLDSLVRLSHSERRVDVLTALSRPGFMTGFVRGLKESDLRLQTVLKPDPDDLNPLYIYEAKMSLLSRIAQGRSGAERLVETRAIIALAECDFVDARPEMDQAFVENDSFLPSATQRYHQLLLPALQVLVALVATLGSKHITAINQILEFFRSHHDTIIILLKTEVDELSISVMEEMRLIVALGVGVLPSVPKTELVATSGYGGVHAAVVGLAARSLGKEAWAASVKPVTDAELVADSERDIPHGVSKFRVRVAVQAVHLRKALVTYLGTASSFTEHEFSPILSPIVGAPRQEDITSRFMITVPTFGDAVDALAHIFDDLAQTLKQFLDFSAELASQDHALANVPEMLDLPVGIILENLSAEQRQALIDHELQKWQTEARERSTVLFECMEMLLLLIWRHLAIYTDEGAELHNLGASMRIAPSFNANSFRLDAARKIGPIVNRLDSTARDAASLGWHPYEKYMTIMSRRLQDVAGLYEPPEGGAQNNMHL